MNVNKLYLLLFSLFVMNFPGVVVPYSEILRRSRETMHPHQRRIP